MLYSAPNLHSWNFWYCVWNRSETWQDLIQDIKEHSHRKNYSLMLHVLVAFVFVGVLYCICMHTLFSLGLKIHYKP